MEIRGFVPSVRSLPFSTVTERHKIFAFDFMFFICKEYNVDWMPLGCTHYFVDPLSPWSPEFEQALKIFLRNRDESFIGCYLEIVPPGETAKVDVFGQYSHEILQDILRKQGQPGDLFNGMAFVGRLAILFYKNGAREAPNYAVVEMGEALVEIMHKFGPGFFVALKDHANNFIQASELASSKS